MTLSYLLKLINAGKGEALRIRAILRSLVPTKDLVGIISIPLKMPMINKGMDKTGRKTQLNQDWEYLEWWKSGATAAIKQTECLFETKKGASGLD